MQIILRLLDEFLDCRLLMELMLVDHGAKVVIGILCHGLVVRFLATVQGMLHFLLSQRILHISSARVIHIHYDRLGWKL